MNYTHPVINALRDAIAQSSSEQVLNLIDNMVKTLGDLRNRISPRWRHDERWDDIERCLLLDGYRIENQVLLAIEPQIEGTVPLEDDLTTALQCSGLATVTEIRRLLDESASAFRRTPPDYNGCLSNARVALETLVRSIALLRRNTYPATFDANIWGQTLAYLRTSDFITNKEEEGISGVYSFVSPGAHRPIGLSEQEMTRLGRSLVLTMCYFLVKLYNG